MVGGKAHAEADDQEGACVLLADIDQAALDRAAATYLQPDGLVFVVVGDRKLVEPQLKDLGLPVEIAPAVDSGAPGGK